jgi:hypothetical protein
MLMPLRRGGAETSDISDGGWKAAARKLLAQ